MSGIRAYATSWWLSISVPAWVISFAPLLGVVLLAVVCLVLMCAE